MSLAGWLEQAQQFYANALADVDVVVLPTCQRWAKNLLCLFAPWDRLSNGVKNLGAKDLSFQHSVVSNQFKSDHQKLTEN